MVTNFEKLKFSQPIVDFAGFRIAEEDIEPLPKYRRDQAFPQSEHFNRHQKLVWACQSSGPLRTSLEIP